MRKGSYLGVLVGGDFNFEPDDPEYRELERAGLKDTYAMASPETEVYSLDPQRNVIAGHGVQEVPSALRAAMRRLPESQQQKILEGYQKGVTQARRVDFLFLMRNSQLRVRQAVSGRNYSVNPKRSQPHQDRITMVCS